MDCHSTATSRLRRFDGEWDGDEVSGPQQQPRTQLPAAGKMGPHLQTWADKVNSIGVMFKNGHVAEGVGCSSWPCTTYSTPAHLHNTTPSRAPYTAGPASGVDPQQMQHDPSCQRTCTATLPMQQPEPLQRHNCQHHPQLQQHLEQKQWEQHGRHQPQHHHHQQQQQRSEDLAQASVQTELPQCTPAAAAALALAGHKRRRSSGDGDVVGTSGQCIEAAWAEAASPATAAEHGAACRTMGQHEQQEQQQQRDQEQQLELRRQRLAALRRVCCVRTMMLLLTECPQMPEPLFLRLPQLSQQLEGQLFASATSLEEYADWGTLRARLRLAGAALRQGQGAWACPAADA